MKNFIEKLLNQKIFVTILIILFLGALGAAAYVIKSVQTNLQTMTENAQDADDLYFPPYPPVNTAGKDPELIKRGEYLAKAGDCIACHTNTTEKGPAFAGGLAMYTPFGTIYSPNITPDNETGIGKWTDEQFIKAMRQGISPQGHFYYPAFPYFYFNNISTEDLLAIKAYLDSVPAVHKPNRPNEMMKPFNERFLQLGWRLMFFRGKSANTGYTVDPKKSAEWNRGAYLVEGLGHCAMCHSPSYHILTESVSLGAPIQKYDLTGAKIQGYLAPNITKINLRTTTVDEIVRVFTEDRLIGGGKVEGPMLEVNHDSLRYLTPQDLRAIAVYLKSVRSAMPPKPKNSGVPGKGVYEAYCAGCHATGAGGAPQFGDPDSWNKVMKAGTAKVYENAIQGKGGMPAKGTCLSCSDDEIKQAVDYMIKAAVNGSAQPKMTKMKPLTMEDGKRVYNESCSSCHNIGINGALKPGDIEAWKPVVQTGFLDTYRMIITGEAGHPDHAGCPKCNDAEIIAALKYMMQQSTTEYNYNLW